MNSMSIYHGVSFETSKTITRKYSTSFSLGIQFLSKQLREPIYAIYGFVRLGDEIVDTFHAHDKSALMECFKCDVRRAIADKISINPILHSFQLTVQKYNIDSQLIEEFIESMEMDLNRKAYTPESYKKYILGSAEVVGLMCLKVFCQTNSTLYKKLKPSAMSLGAAYQKVNFLRDIKHDYSTLGRMYFPGLSIDNFDTKAKEKLTKDIENDFKQGYKGINLLPLQAKFGVFLTYIYYKSLFKKIKKSSPEHLIQKRIRLSNGYKYILFLSALFRSRLRLI